MVMRKGYFCIMIGMLMMVAFSGCKPKKVITNKDMAYVVVSDNNSDAKVSLSEALGIEIDDSDDFVLLEAVAGWLGVPYKYGGSTKKGVDCSGFIVNIYNDVYGIKLYRSSADMKAKNCKSIPDKKLRMGDLVFFATSKNKRRVNHVGLYLKNGRFIHASSSKGVIVSDMDERYYRRTYIGSGRVH